MLLKLLFGPIGKGLALFAAVGLVFGVGYRSGAQSTKAKYEAAIQDAYSTTKEAIENAPTYSPDDPAVLRELCRMAGIEPCDLRDNDAESN